MIEVGNSPMLIAPGGVMALTTDLEHLHCASNVQAVAFTCQGIPVTDSNNILNTKWPLWRDAVYSTLPYGLDMGPTNI